MECEICGGDHPTPEGSERITELLNGPKAPREYHVGQRVKFGAGGRNIHVGTIISEEKVHSVSLMALLLDVKPNVVQKLEISFDALPGIPIQAISTDPRLTTIDTPDGEVVHEAN